METASNNNQAGHIIVTSPNGGESLDNSNSNSNTENHNDANNNNNNVSKGRKVDLTERDVVKLLKVDGMPRDLDSTMVDLFTMDRRQFYCFPKYEHSPSLVSYACIVVFPSRKVFRAGYPWSPGRSKPPVTVFGIVSNAVKFDFPRALYCRQSDGVLVTKSVAEVRAFSSDGLISMN